MCENAWGIKGGIARTNPRPLNLRYFSSLKDGGFLLPNFGKEDVRVLSAVARWEGGAGVYKR